MQRTKGKHWPLSHPPDLALNHSFDRYGNVLLVARSRDIDRQVIAELTTETARRRARSRRLRALRCQSAVDGTADRTAPDLPVVRADGGDFDVVLLRHGRAGVSELRGRSLDVGAALDSRSDRLPEHLRGNPGPLRTIARGDKLPTRKELRGALRRSLHDRSAGATHSQGRRSGDIAPGKRDVHARERIERPVGLRPHLEKAFEADGVRIDFVGYPAETFHGAIAEPLDKIRTGRLTPKSIHIRLLVSHTTTQLALPVATSGTTKSAPAPGSEWQIPAPDPSAPSGTPYSNSETSNSSPRPRSRPTRSVLHRFSRRT